MNSKTYGNKWLDYIGSCPQSNLCDNIVGKCTIFLHGWILGFLVCGFLFFVFHLWQLDDDDRIDGFYSTFWHFRTIFIIIIFMWQHFEGFVVGHFCQRALSILDACKAYMDGAQVGTLASGGIQDVDEGDKSCSATFKASVSQIFPLLIEAFKEKGFSLR